MLETLIIRAKRLQEMSKCQNQPLSDFHPKRQFGRFCTPLSPLNGFVDLFPGYYMYTESTGVHIGTNAVLVSPTLDWNSALTCVTFWYSMEGSQMGSLALAAAPARGEGSSHTATVWSRSGDQGHGWRRTSVTVHTTGPVQVGYN